MKTYISNIFKKIKYQDVVDAYLLLLNRKPESDAVINEYLKFKNINAIHESIKTSNEYLTKSAKNTPSDPTLQNKIVNTSKNIEHVNASKLYKILFIGNCQVLGLAALCNAMSNKVEATGYELTPAFINDLKNNKAKLAEWADIDAIWLHPHHESNQWFAMQNEEFNSKVKFLPTIDMLGFHPDCVYVTKDKSPIDSPIGAYHSALIFWGFRMGFTAEQTAGLFSENIFKYLDYFELYESNINILIERGRSNDLPMADWIMRWERRGVWMHSINHPKIYVLSDIARHCLESLRIKCATGVEDVVTDELSFSPCWPVYPEITNILNLPGSYDFKVSRALNNINRPVRYIGLKQFIDESYIIYHKYESEELHCTRLDSVLFKGLAKFISENSERQIQDSSVTVNSVNPYAGLPDHQFWRRSIANKAMEEVDPVISVRFKILKTSKIATAGSCFAQHISRTLTASGFQYFVTENADELSLDERKRRNFGVFSARFGNIYTARQLLQLSRFALNNLQISDDLVWKRDDGRFVDALRPYIEPDGFSTTEEVEKSRLDMLAGVRRMLMECDVFVFTLGLTEHWYRLHDGHVLPVAPGVVSTHVDASQYRFGNFSLAETVADMQVFLLMLKAVNPEVRVILTVSPVPLVATYESKSVLTSTTYSKSVLRVAAEELVNRFDWVDYYPSYEIITGNFNKGAYFEADLRSVKEEGVAHVMRLFMKYFTQDHDDNTRGQFLSIAKNNVEIQAERLNEIKEVSEVVCDEEHLDDKNL